MPGIYYLQAKRGIFLSVAPQLHQLSMKKRPYEITSEEAQLLNFYRYDPCSKANCVSPFRFSIGISNAGAAQVYEAFFNFMMYERYLTKSLEFSFVFAKRYNFQSYIYLGEDGSIIIGDRQGSYIMINNSGITIHSASNIVLSSESRVILLSENAAIKANKGVVISALSSDTSGTVGSVDIRANKVGVYSRSDIKMGTDEGSISMIIHGFPHLSVNYGEVSVNSNFKGVFISSANIYSTNIGAEKIVSPQYYVGRVEMVTNKKYKTYGCTCNTLSTCGQYNSDLLSSDKKIKVLQETSGPKGYIPPASNTTYKVISDGAFGPGQISYEPAFNSLQNCFYTVEVSEIPASSLNEVCRDSDTGYEEVQNS